jgi:hypothetical protein
LKISVSEKILQNFSCKKQVFFSIVAPPPNDLNKPDSAECLKANLIEFELFWLNNW